jgi:hypothetical protein
MENSIGAYHPKVATKIPMLMKSMKTAQNTNFMTLKIPLNREKALNQRI